MPRHGHARLLLLAALLASAASAQPSDDDYGQGQQVHVSTAMIALLAAVIAVFVFIAFFTVYLRHCTRSSAADDERAMMPNFDALISRSRRQRQQRRPRGLDADVVEAFPTMRYAEAKALRVGNGALMLECAVCLSEFEDEERLRLLLPRCSHAFHPDCIGEWLACHVTCPVCRCNLDPAASQSHNNKDTTSSSDDEDRPPAAAGFFVSPMTIPVASSVSSSETAAVSGPLPVAAVVIDVVTEEEEEEEALELQQIGTQRRAAMNRSKPVPTTTQLARAHSTGHSLAVAVAVRLDQDLERFTLRLPEHVRREMGEHYSMQLRRGRRGAGGEGSSRGGGGGRSAPLSRAAGSRWQSLLARTFSGTGGKLSSFFSASSRMTVSSELVGEVSSSSSSSTRARGKRVAAVDAADVPVRLGGSGAASREVALVAAAAADEEKKAAATQQVLRT